MRPTILLFALLLPILLFSQNIGKIPAQSIDSLLTASRTADQLGDTEEALRLAEEARQLAEKAFGKKDSLYARTVGLLGVIHYRKGDYEAAEPYYLEAHDINRQTMGEDSEAYAASAFNLCLLYQKSNRFQEAETLGLQAVELRRKYLGASHPEYGKALGAMGNVYIYSRQFERAEAYVRQWLDFNEKNLGASHPETAKALGNISMVLQNLGQFEAAETASLRCLSIYEKTKGKESKEYLNGLAYLGVLYGQTEQFEKATPVLEEVLVLHEKLYGKNNIRYAAYLSNMVLLHSNQGQFETAEQYIVETEKIIENLPPDPYFAAILDNFGTFFSELGQVDQAEKRILNGQKLRAELLGKDNVDYAKSLQNLGTLYWQQNQLDKAEIQFSEAVHILEKIGAERNPVYAFIADNLAVIFMETDRLKEAETLYEKSKTLVEEIYGKDHSEYGLSLKNLAALHYRLGDLDRAEQEAVEAKAILESAFGKYDFHHRKSCVQLGQIYAEKKQTERAAALFKEHDEIAQKLLENASVFMSFEELDNYSELFKEDQSRTLAFIGENHQQMPVLTTEAYEIVLRSKGILLEKNMALEQFYRRQKDALQEDYELYREAKELVSYWLIESDAESESELEKAEEEANRLEKKLVAKAASIKGILEVPTMQEIMENLPENSAAIEFFHFEDDFFKVQYAALVMLGHNSQPIWIDLFGESELKIIMLEKLWQSVDNQPFKNLYDLVWKPIFPHLQNMKTLYFSPSGLLHQIPLAALPDASGQPIGFFFEMHQLGSTRQLVNRKSTAAFVPTSATIFGGIRYDMDSTAIRMGIAFQKGNQMDDNGEWSSGMRGNGWQNATDKIAWDYLPWTKVEAKFIGNIFEKQGLSHQIYSDYAASEEQFNHLTTTSILHIATHGYFFPDPIATDSESPAHTISQNAHPLIRSGLILAGANHAWQGKPPIENMQDGILTSFEVAQLDLSSTELVVLSACDTGLGDLHHSEGVLGLQRAFSIAGARYLLVSLWQVPDRITQQLMTAFYTQLLEEKQSVPRAFQEAQKLVMAKHPNSMDWAAFVLME